MRPESGSGWLQISDKPKKKDNDFKICWHNVIVNFFHLAVFVLSRLVTGSSFMSIIWLVQEIWQFLSIQNRSEIRKSEMHRSEFCQISGDWSNLELRDTKFGANVSNKKLLNAEKYQGYSFYCFWIIRGKPKKRGGG